MIEIVLKAEYEVATATVNVSPQAFVCVCVFYFFYWYTGAIVPGHPHDLNLCDLTSLVAASLMLGFCPV